MLARDEATTGSAAQERVAGAGNGPAATVQAAAAERRSLVDLTLAETEALIAKAAAARAANEEWLTLKEARDIEAKLMLYDWAIQRFFNRAMAAVRAKKTPLVNTDGSTPANDDERLVAAFRQLVIAVAEQVRDNQDPRPGMKLWENVAGEFRRDPKGFVERASRVFSDSFKAEGIGELRAGSVTATVHGFAYGQVGTPEKRKTILDALDPGHTGSIVGELDNLLSAVLFDLFHNFQIIERGLQGLQQRQAR